MHSSGTAQALTKSSVVHTHSPSESVRSGSPHPRRRRAHCRVVVWLIAAKLHSHHPGHFRPYPLILFLFLRAPSALQRSGALFRVCIYVFLRLGSWKHTSTPQRPGPLLLCSPPPTTPPRSPVIKYVIHACLCTMQCTYMCMHMHMHMHMRTCTCTCTCTCAHAHVHVWSPMRLP